MPDSTLQRNADGALVSAAPILAFLLVSLCGARANAEGLRYLNCDDPAARGPFIAKSLESVNSGGDRQPILDTLTCIARAEDTNGLVGMQAVAAIFHIAEDNGPIQEHLLRIVGDDKAGRSSRSMACQLLVYVADETGRDELLRQLKRRWPRNTSGELSALIELGDQGVLEWLEGTAVATKVDELRTYLEGLAESVRAQKNSDLLLAMLQSQVGNRDRGWLVRQAMRYGATREAIRHAVLTYLRRCEPSKDVGLTDSSLFTACEECRIFKDRDVAEFPAIGAFRDRMKYIVAEPVIQEWATLIETKRAEFYGLNREN